MITVKEFADHMLSKGMDRSEFDERFLRKYNMTVSEAPPEMDISLLEKIGSASAARTPEAEERNIRAMPGFGDKIAVDQFESVGKAQSTPISTLGSAIGGIATGLGEAFAGVPTALSLLPGAVELGVQKRTGKVLEGVRGRTSEKFDAYKARVEAGENVPEAERLALLSEVEANQRAIATFEQ
tara:strand:- start:259 stop:807 length:549 start_codon:yes stop_codon:yes gene_type:complete